MIAVTPRLVHYACEYEFHVKFPSNHSSKGITFSLQLNSWAFRTKLLSSGGFVYILVNH